MRPQSDSTSLISKLWDFWLLGGASIVFWVFMITLKQLKEFSEPLEKHFVGLAPVFALLLVFCNYPHFMMSYKFAYGQGTKFVWKNWISLVAVPVLLAASFGLAFFLFETEIDAFQSVGFINLVTDKVGLDFRLGSLKNLGTEILSFSVLLMFLLVGWHYSKQVFGCVILYSRYEKYPLSQLQRNLIKWSLLSVAVFNFLYLSIYSPQYNSTSVPKTYFLNIPSVPLGLPGWFIPLSELIVGVLTVASAYLIFYRNYKNKKILPSLNLITPWIAFYIWWIPVSSLGEYYFLAVPFFHSLQYLAFAYRRDVSRAQNMKKFNFTMSVRVVLLLFMGLITFELLPSFLDSYSESYWNFRTWFFMISIPVFINIHHYFIDSVTWKFESKEVSESLLKNWR
ncbi:MAG: hypothetical protein KA715_07825 [Xanthomonadaceae bacterium]|nr:hypothetical protein [Xanthomonadaceae bacterium]